MENLYALKGPDFVMLAADSIKFNALFISSHDFKRIYKAGEKTMLAAVGAGAGPFVESILKSTSQYKLKNHYELSPRAVANFARQQLAGMPHTARQPLQINMFVAGYDETMGPELKYIDCLASANSINYGGHGCGKSFCASICDRFWKPDLSQDRAYDILKVCVQFIQKRSIVNLCNFKVAVVDKNGIRSLNDLNPESLSGFKFCE